MIEIIYNDEKQEEKKNQPHFHLPKNIRQIGDIDKGKKIYIEDYAVTFINQFSAANITQPCAAILLGRVNWLEGVQYIFISSVLSVKEIEVTQERVVISDDTWTQIYEDVDKYFKNQEIVGWFLSMPGASLEITDAITRVHTNHFAGNDKVFFMREVMEKDEAFFVFENGQLIRQHGYYIYYEKNLSMQDYMVIQNGGKSVDKPEAISDKAIANFRKILEEKKEVSSPPKMMAFMYAASTFLVMTVLVIGITMINNYDKMKNMEKTLANLSDTVSTDGAGLAAVSQGKVKEEGQVANVENITGGVTPETKEVVPEESETQAPVETETPAPPETEPIAQEPVEPETPADAGQQAPVEDAPANADGSINQYYTVEIGDTVAGISKKFYGSMERVTQICEVNGLANADTIYPGQKILLP